MSRAGNSEEYRESQADWEQEQRGLTDREMAEARTEMVHAIGWNSSASLAEEVRDLLEGNRNEGRHSWETVDTKDCTARYNAYGQLYLAARDSGEWVGERMGEEQKEHLTEELARNLAGPELRRKVGEYSGDTPASRFFQGEGRIYGQEEYDRAMRKVQDDLGEKLGRAETMIAGALAHPDETRGEQIFMSGMQRLEQARGQMKAMENGDFRS